MSEQETASADSAAKSPDSTAPATVKKGTVVILLVILFSLAWYLAADRFTPYTKQARVQGYVVGVAPKVAGIVTSVSVRNNQQVSEGQVLFQIDRDQYQIALRRAQSDLENTVRQISAGEAGVESAKANLQAALANLTRSEQDTNRQERLYQEDPGAISVRRLESARASLQQARAKVAAAEAEIQRAIEQKGGEGANNAKLKTAQSAVEKAELDLENTTVRASSAGIITDLRTDVGQYAGTGSPVMTLIAIHDVWVSAEFTENNLGHMQVGTPVEIVIDALPGKVVAGSVKSIGLGISASQSAPAGSLPTIENSRDWLRQSQRFPVVVKFDPEEIAGLKDNLRIGGQAEVMAYSEGHGMLKLMGKLYMRLMSLLSYVY
jgi:multidrug resistance efflux pump